VPQGTTLIYAVGFILGVPQGTSVHSLCSFTVLGHKKRLDAPATNLRFYEEINPYCISS
jgi:hypothetical protein